MGKVGFHAGVWKKIMQEHKLKKLTIWDKNILSNWENMWLALYHFKTPPTGALHIKNILQGNLYPSPKSSATVQSQKVFHLCSFSHLSGGRIHRQSFAASDSLVFSERCWLLINRWPRWQRACWLNFSLIWCIMHWCSLYSTTWHKNWFYANMEWHLKFCLKLLQTKLLQHQYS